ncbi:hypothetical protein ACFL1G_00020 [Planctomycetota bacterium]
MKSEKQTTAPPNPPAFPFGLSLCIVGLLGFIHLSVMDCFAVTSEIVRHKTNADFSQGKTESVIIDSKGTIKLGRSAKTLVKKFKNLDGSKDDQNSDYEPWSINSIVVSGGTIYIGTSPNGGIYKYSMGKLSKIYPLESDNNEKQQSNSKTSDEDEPDNSNTVDQEQYLKNEHIFAMTSDVAGRLLAGISGNNCRLIRFEKSKPVTIFEHEDTKYIFAIAVADDGDIYVGTGPEGKLFRLNPLGRQPQLVYDSTDKNILSLVIGDDGLVYAGTDTRGLVYQINPATKTAKALYDSDQPEITSLLFAEADSNSDLFSAATSAEITETEAVFVPGQSQPGRPETPKEDKNNIESKGGLNLKIANTKQTETGKTPPVRKPTPKPAGASKASFIYKIDKEGFVTDVFTESAVFFALAKQGENLLIGTGNSGRLFAVEPSTERKALIYEDKQATQITSVCVDGEDVYIGTANPAKFIKVGVDFVTEGTYASALIDGKQPTKWGKLQIDADIPESCKVVMACRSGNVEDVNDPTFSEWTAPIEITEPIQMQCPISRFCQYKLILQTKDGKDSPLIREVALAHTIPNLKPKVESVDIERIEAKEKEGFFKISYKAKDDNEDQLTYKIDFRKAGRTNWIELEEEYDKDSFEWNSRTVEDGRYELRVTASDEKSNMPASGLAGSRISETVVVDNTAPLVKEYNIKKTSEAVILKLQIVDELSAIGELLYTVNSNDKFKSAVPDDRVYDTTEESFTIEISDLQVGENIIAVKLSDNVGNTAYKTFEVELAR